VTARPDGPPVSHPGFGGHPDVEVVDTTGAGDAFAAGYVAAQLAGLDAEGRLAVGNACGALATTVVGARAQFDREAVGRLAGAAAF
jgi:ribokinase